MTPERWQQLKQIFQSALERNPAERSAFLQQACGGDSILLREVESLIASHDQAGDSIQALAAEAATEMLSAGRTHSIAGKHIGRYQVLSLIGRGGMGEVYLAQDESLGRKVAIKLLRAEFTGDEERLHRFRQEARAASALNHPNIITIYEIGSEDTTHFMATEHVQGKTLRQHISRAAITLLRILDISVQVASALSAAHQAGIIHRDIKPENIMLREDGYVKVLDFGLAKLIESAAGDTAAWALPKLETTPGVVMGTVSYMSPEQARGLATDQQTDIWSLGVVVYEMVAGRQPFIGETSSDILASILQKQPVPLARYSQDVPVEMERIVNKALCKNSEQRYQTAEELFLDLKTLRHQLEFEVELSRLSPPDSTEKAAAQVAVERPETRYAKSGDVNIAYQVVGSGPLDLVFVMGWVTNLDYMWEEPSYARFLNRLASFSRLILFDKRGTGLSDRVHESELPTLEQRMDDVRAVMDAVGSHRAVLFGVSEGGPMSALFAATYPQRTTALILYASFAKRFWSPDYPWAPTLEKRQEFYDLIQKGWGGVLDLPIMAPSVAGDATFRTWWAAYMRHSASPGAALAFARMNSEIDISHILSTIRVPTLIIHRTGDLDVDVGGSRYMAHRIPDSKYVELPGIDHMVWVGDQGAILDNVREFLTGIQDVPEFDRVLATVLVAGVKAPSQSQQWQELFRRDLARFRGREIEATGKTMMATFDGPARAIRAACAITNAARWLGLEIKAGLHTGECDMVGDKPGGIAVDIAIQVEAKAEAGDVLVSSTVKDLVAGSGIDFEDRGNHSLEGITRQWRLFAVKRERSPY